MITTLKDIKIYAIEQVKNKKVILHRESLYDIIEWISSKNLCMLRQSEMNSYYISEKKYYNYIITNLENL